MASPERGALLQRAIASIRSASRHPVAIIVIVNGTRSEPDVLEWLRAQPDVQLDIMPEPSLPHALLRGRQLVKTPFFSTLDDDDEYLEGAIDLRLAVLEEARADLVVCNGYKRRNGIDRLVYPTLSRVPSNPLEELFTLVWLQSCNALYRTERVSEAFFADYHPYAEWSWLGYNLALQGRLIAFTDLPTYVCHDTPGSLSKSTAYRTAYMSLYDKMLTLAPSRAVARQIRRRIQAAWHDQSCQALDEGKHLEAWRCHLLSLVAGGLRYLTYSRYLLPGWPKGSLQ